MLPVSFRWFTSSCVPVRIRRKQAVLGLTLLVVSGCGGGCSAEGVHSPWNRLLVRGSRPTGRFSRKGREVQAAQGTQLISVTRFPLLHPFSGPISGTRSSPSSIARRQRSQPSSRAPSGDSRDVTIAGRQARRYDIAYTREGKQLVERIAFVLRGKSEFLLLCRYEPGGKTDACDDLLTSFKLAAA